MHRLVFPLVVCLSFGCASKTAKQEEPVVEEEVEVEPTFEHPDPGPLLDREAVPAVVDALPDETVEAVSAARSGDHLFITVPFSASVQSVEARVLGDRHGMIVPDIGPTRLFVRLVGTQMPETLEIEWRGHDVDKGEVRVAHQKLAVTDITGAATESDLPSRFRTAAAEAMRNSRNNLGFYRFAESRLGLMADPRAAQARGSGRTEVGSLMDLYTGFTSVKEALQYDRGLLLRGKRIRPEIAIDQIEGIGLPSHPWPKMISELDTNPDLDELASMVPHDMGYLHARDIRALIQVLHDVDEWVTPLSQAAEENPGPAHFTQRYKDQLVIETTGLAETFGPMIAAEVAVVSSDPFYREGTDVSLIFKVENGGLLTKVLDGFEAKARARRTDIRESSYEVEGVRVRVISTPDRAISQHRYEVDGTLVLSNSRGAVEKLLAVRAQKTPSLAESGEYRYFRALYPASDEVEDAFVFLSDAFVHHATSPRVKILEARRMRAQADLKAVNYAALLFGWLEGRQPRNVDELLASGVLFDDELAHSVDGSPIGFETSKGARSKWGSAAMMVPIIDLEIDKVDAAEKAAYEEFRRTYQTYWRGQIDPIGARISRSDDGALTVDARTLPLIESTDYDELVELVGRKSFVPTSAPDQARLTFAVGEEARLRAEAEGMLKSFSGGREGFGLGWLGDWVAVGTTDRSGLWDLGLASGEVGPNNNLDRSVEEIVLLGRAPLYAMAQIRNKIAFAALISGVRKFLEETAPGMVDWKAAEPYRETPITMIRANDDDLAEFAIYYTSVDDVVMVAFERATMKILIDEALAGRLATSAEPRESVIPRAASMDTQAELQLDLADSSWLAKTLAGLIEPQMVQAASASRLSYLALYKGFGGVLDNDDVRRFGLAYLGYEPRHPHGGQFDVVDGWVVDPVYGSLLEITTPKLPVANSPISNFLGELDGADFRVGFAGQGMHRGLHVRFTIRGEVK